MVKFTAQLISGWLLKVSSCRLTIQMQGKNSKRLMSTCFYWHQGLKTPVNYLNPKNLEMYSWLPLIGIEHEYAKRIRLKFSIKLLPKSKNLKGTKTIKRCYLPGWSELQLKELVWNEILIKQSKVTSRQQLSNVLDINETQKESEETLLKLERWWWWRKRGWEWECNEGRRAKTGTITPRTVRKMRRRKKREGIRCRLLAMDESFEL